MEYNILEFHPELGCYIKWIHGDPKQQIEKMYSMSAFHFYAEPLGFIKHFEYYKYAQYLQLSVMSILNNTQDWHVRVYIDESIFSPLNTERKIWNNVLNMLKKFDRVQILCVRFVPYFFNDSKTHQGLLAVFFRYLPLFDPNVSVCLFRDIDNIWTEQHDYFVNKWLESSKDICVFLNMNYKRQEIKDLTVNDVVFKDEFYRTILSGLWNIRKDMGYKFPISLWHKMFAYIESYTDFVNSANYVNYKYYKVRFTYGFDELILTRVAMPIFLDMGLKVYALPIKIFDVDYYNNLFNPALYKFFRTFTTIDIIKNLQSIIVNKYWNMSDNTSGLSQYLACFFANMYFKIISGRSYVKNDQFINTLKYQIYPTPILMAIGLFTFKNIFRYEWYPYSKTIAGTNIADKIVVEKKQVSYAELTCGGQFNPDDPEIPIYPPPDPNDPYSNI